MLSASVLYGAEPGAQSKDQNSHDKTVTTHSVWMSKLSGNVSLAALNIPGTHNSGALHEPFPKTARCQTLTIMGQLEVGVRFFDIRCRHEKDQFAIFHGPIDQHLSFDEVLQDMLAFLKRNTRETLILSIKEEHAANAPTRSFGETLQSYIDRSSLAWYTKETIPNLGAVRGKIVLLRRFRSPNKPLGMPATDWGHNGFYRGPNLFIQDRFKIPDAGIKWKTIEKAFEHSLKDSSDRLHLHFASGYTQNSFGIPNITKVSTPINQNLTEYLKRAAHLRHGCVVLDFITPDLAEAIYQLNFPANK